MFQHQTLKSFEIQKFTLHNGIRFSSHISLS